MDSLNAKTAVITGAASGIGLELARRCAAEGMNLVLADVEVAPLEAVTAELTNDGHAVASMTTDVRDLDQLIALESLARERFGNVHLLCNNAGVGGGGAVADMDNLEVWRWVIDVDLWGVIYGCKAFVSNMVEHGEQCHVVNTASMAGLGSAPGLGAYCVAKHGVVALSETLSMEMQMANTAVGVSVLCPAFVKTGIGRSERNLPEELKDYQAPSAEGGMRDIVDALVAGGISTELVADAVLEAVIEDRFWILTHDDSPDQVMARANGIVAGTRPGIIRPTT